METAPLTLAHTHARNAVLETRKSNPVAASEEHDLAAGEFATASQSSADREALRTLQLLEGHHKKLAQILRFQHENPPSAVVAETSSPAMSPSLNSQPSTAELGATKAAPSTPDAQQLPPRLSGNSRMPARETSSIASNLASMRGIPSNLRRASPASPTLSSQQAGAKMTDTAPKIKAGESRLRGTQAYGQKERSSRTSTPKQPWSPPAISPTDITSQQLVPPETLESQRQEDRTTDEPFQRFYSTVEGLISKISAPLAFAGLPLGSETPAQQDTSSRRKSSAETRINRNQAISDSRDPTNEPDVSRLFSRAALRAIRDTTGGGGTGNTAESFYVVPTTGGTVSYAGILSRAEKEARRNSLEEADEDFVDARETPSSPEMRQSQTRSKGKKGQGNDKFSSIQNPKTLEELQMENQALKHLSDTLSKRLHMWEVNAQSSSIALQQSLKAMHHQNNVPSDQPPRSSSPAVVSPGPGVSAITSADHEQRIKELEEIVRLNERELDKVGRENDKLRNVLGRYRERWEKLKEGAKTRRAEGKAGGDTDNPGNRAAAGSAVQGIDNPPDTPTLADDMTENGMPAETEVKANVSDS
ncbi:hypothetical protein MW887_011614 [Aspergillus wentii]|nr:hypothetical protein MW887_011614 [Aspergillus wentii]